MQYSEGISNISLEEILRLYASVGWINYTKDPEALSKALKNSSYIACALHNDKLVGLVRSISDDVSIHFIQDILVLGKFHRQGIGKKLMELALERYKHVPKHVLLTDDEPKQHAFYNACGFEELPTKLNNNYVCLNGYIRL